ncbi:MAG: branched-chain-amino-acid transaminase [Candidatus Methylacidiphilales bacterium]
MKIYIDGSFFEEHDAKISVFDHGLLYGDGIFEGIRAYNGRVFRMEQHIDRLYDSAKAILLSIPLSKAEMTDAVLETLRQNQMREGYVRLVVTRGVGYLGLSPDRCAKPTVFIIAAKLELYPREFYDKGLSVVTVATQRTSPAALNPAVKSLNYLNNIMAKIEGKLAGVHEVVMLNSEGLVAECSGDNIFTVKKGKIFTPPIYMGALGGITREVIMDLAGSLGLELKEQPLTRYDLFVADEMFLTGTGAEVIPVVNVDGRVIGDGQPGEITRRLLGEFNRETQETGTPIGL